MRKHIHLHKQRFIHKRHILKALNHKGLLTLQHLLHGKGMHQQQHIKHSSHQTHLTKLSHTDQHKKPLKFKSLF